MSRRQHEFLEKDLKAVDRNKTPWVITLAHRPFYCSLAFNNTDVSEPDRHDIKRMKLGDVPWDRTNKDCDVSGPMVRGMFENLFY